MTPPQQSELPPQPKSWPGNLPCCPSSGPREDGCDAQNPTGEQPLFWDPTLFPPLHTNKGRPKNKSNNRILNKILSVLAGGNSQNTINPNKKKENEGVSTGTLVVHTAAAATPVAAPAIIHIPPALPRDNPVACTSLPLDHPFVPFYLCFYHVFAAMNAATTMTYGDGSGVIRELEPEPNLLGALACRGVTGSRSGWWRRLMQPVQITWSIRPKIISDSEWNNTKNPSSSISTADKHFLIEYDYSFFINAEHPGPKVSTTRGYYSKRWLNFSLRGSRPGSTTFAPCLHCQVVLRSVTERVDWHGVRSMSVGYSVSIPGSNSSNSDNVEEGDSQAELVQHAEWKSGDEVLEVQGQQSPVANVLSSCGLCYTDFGIRFQEGSMGIRVVVLVYKDLGRCGHEPDEFWKAATGAGVDLSDKRTLPPQRPRSDFGGIAGVFSGIPRI